MLYDVGMLAVLHGVFREKERLRMRVLCVYDVESQKRRYENEYRN